MKAFVWFALCEDKLLYLKAEGRMNFGAYDFKNG